MTSPVLAPLLVVLGMMAQARPEPALLRPDELVLVFNRRSKPSGELAIEYAEQRNVPREHLVAVDVPTADGMTREQYQGQVVDVLRRELRSRGLEHRVRCAVTFYDVPLRIRGQAPRPRDLARAAVLDGPYDETVAELERVIAVLGQVGHTPAATAPTAAPGRARPQPLPKLLQRYEHARAQAAGRVARLTDPAVRRQHQSRLVGLVTQAQGVAGIAQQMRPRPGADPAARARSLGEIETLLAQVRQVGRDIDALLAGGPHGPKRDQAWPLIRRWHGLTGLLLHLDRDRQRLRSKENVASVDSELSLLWWGDYSPHRWVPNTLNVRRRKIRSLAGGLVPGDWARPVLMVSRLDGPSPAIVRRIISDSIAAERTGLTGRVYIDARGITKRDAYGIYDAGLRSLDRLLRNQTRLAVTRDNKPALFGPGACPQTALYCGWYSLAKYVDAFDFVPGAVAFHVASSEAVSLRDRGKRYWCKELLRDGVAATLGPVAEPYLSAFPPARDFFGLLATGRYSIVECYYFTKPFNSWMMLLVADPLYRPFAARGHLTLDDVFPEGVSFPAPAGKPPASP